jgi:hypothetical protein
MRHLLAFGLLGLLASTPVQAQEFEAAASVAAAHGLKAVPRSDKSSGELIGTVRSATDLGAICGVRQTFVVLDLKGLLPYSVPAAVYCAGGSLPGQCLALRPGQRVRFQGRLLPVADPNRPGFVACNPNTWTVFLPMMAFGATGVTK